MSAAPNPQTTWALAHRLREDGRIDAAADAVATLWKNAQSDIGTTLAALTFLKECGAHERAHPIARAARQRWPGDARIAANAGEIALALGAFEEAAAALREAIDLDPAQGACWLRLAHCRRFDARDDADVQRFARAWTNSRLDAATHVCTGFALGKALDDLGDYAQAAAVLREANALARAASNWRIENWRSAIQSQRHAPPLPAVPVDANFVPIFIVGLPRTGTTLVASALARHAEVRDRGELNWIPALFALLDEQRQLQHAQALASIAALIRAQMRRDDAPARFYIDKNPLNFRYLDFIAACFPNAKIVYCRRGARDTALSIWMQHFAHEDLGFAYDFASIAAVAHDGQTLMAHWRARLPLDLIEVDYENFVAAPQPQQRRLAQFLGLAALPTETSNPTTRGLVTTASVWQVRQPVYQSAVERWRRYATFLPELGALFGDETM